MNDIIEFFEHGLKRSIGTFLRSSGLSLEIGPGNYPYVGRYPYVVSDELLDYPQWDADCDAIPFENEKFRTIHAYHVLEHVKEPISLLREMERVLKPEGHINIVVPYALSELAHGDLDHKHTFTEETWKNLFNNHGYDKHSKEPWQLKVHLNCLFGVTYRNLCVFTQLKKVVK